MKIIILIPVILRICCFIPFIAYINPLCVVYIRYLIIFKGLSYIAAFGTIKRIKTFSVFITSHSVSSCIGIAGSCAEIVSPGISRAAGRCYFSPEKVWKCLCRILSGHSCHHTGPNSRHQVNCSQGHYISCI